MDEIQPLYAFSYSDPYAFGMPVETHVQYMFLFGQGQQFKLSDTRWKRDNRNIM